MRLISARRSLMTRRVERTGLRKGRASGRDGPQLLLMTHTIPIICLGNNNQGSRHHSLTMAFQAKSKLVSELANPIEIGRGPLIQLPERTRLLSDGKSEKKDVGMGPCTEAVFVV